ncbi:fimbrial biogenesis chaperone [Dyella sp. 2RAB6]|uniref:fimbrial biogenesis chaperone n=1 Tax=Dyella sp. 2RAB6 TaxID=3232992 RepID=UPI003F90D987
MVQSWLDTGDPRQAPDSIRTPFVLMPPMARLDAGRSQIVRIVYTGEPLPVDKESVFWLNVLEIPPKSTKDAGQNTLQFAIRSRIKLFFRPDGIKSKSDEAAAQLSWSVVREGDRYMLEAVNNSPYHVSLSAVHLDDGGKDLDGGDGMVEPQGRHRFTLKGLQAPPGHPRVTYVAIDDYGASRDYSATPAG